MRRFAKKTYLFLEKFLPQKTSQILKKIFKNAFDTIEQLPLIVKIRMRSFALKRPIFLKNSYWIQKEKKGTPGCNLLGFIRADFGLGQHIRYVCDGFNEQKIPFSVKDYSNLLIKKNIRDDSYTQYINNHLNYRCHIHCDSYMMTYLNTSEIQKKRYHIFYGYWELNDFPNSLLKNLNCIDEIWAPTLYIQKMLSEKSVLPVVHMPIPIQFKIRKPLSKKDFGLPENKFLFLFSFDFSSVSIRKNPWAIIEAYEKAFKNQDSVHLVIKCFTDKNNCEIEIFRSLKERINPINMTLLFENFERDKMNALLNLCNCYVSLHRAEGLGLGMAESMFLGKPVIATNFSGNTDFMNTKNGCLVDYELVKVNKGEYFNLEENSFWADADTDHAAFYMKKIVNDKTYREKIAYSAAIYMKENHNPNIIGENYLKRLKLLNLI